MLTLWVRTVAREYSVHFLMIWPGWKVVLTQRVPQLTAAAVPAMFEDLVASTPELVELSKTKASHFDWALHPGGSTIITGVEKVMGLTPEHLRASYEVYMNHGNSSSATIFSVMNCLMNDTNGRSHIVGCAFGPGIAIEMMMFKRVQESRSGSESPGDTPVPEELD